jgi:holo-[acyl-carrier protein] synthase
VPFSSATNAPFSSAVDTLGLLTCLALSVRGDVLWSNGCRMIIGTGIDIVNVARINTLIARAGDRFLRRWFSEEEMAYCNAKASPGLHFAARLAAKEALIKAIHPAGTGSILFKDVSVVSGVAGAPSLRLSGGAATLAEHAGATTFYLSLSHTTEYAVASVIATTDCSPEG